MERYFGFGDLDINNLSRWINEIKLRVFDRDKVTV